MLQLGQHSDILLHRAKVIVFMVCALALWAGQICAEPAAQDSSLPFQSEEALDLHCLKTSYPEIRDLRTDADGRRWLVLRDGREVLYAATATPAPDLPADHVVDVRTSMQARYPLEPLRPDLPPGFSPGRWRSQDLLSALYGASQEEVRQKLVPMPFFGKKILVSPAVAPALAAVGAELAPLATGDKYLRSLLVPAGGFAWRRVAGERYLSSHAFGIAIDIGVRIATYWRWCKLRPHPLQRDYPQAIVAAFERQGFVWGGKWHEYDLMHFEYRPELICKARTLRDGADRHRSHAAAGSRPLDLPSSSR